LTLHPLALDVLKNGWVNEAAAFFNRANDLEMQVSGLIAP